MSFFLNKETTEKTTDCLHKNKQKKKLKERKNKGILHLKKEEAMGYHI